MSSSYNSISSFSTLPCLLSGIGAGIGANNFNRSQETMIRQPNSVAPPPKKLRNKPGNPNPDADVIALSPETIMATNRFICEKCDTGFQREQNLQLHRRTHNLPWKLKQNSNKEVRRKVYICPEPSCVHHDPARALGDLTGIRKHYYRKHGEKTLKCKKCSKRYAVESDRKAHEKTCGIKEYRCECGTIFARRDSYITHKTFCEALIPESAKTPTVSSTAMAAAAGGGGRYGFYGSAASSLSHNHFGNSSTSRFAPPAAGYYLKSEEFVPRSANPNPGGHANFIMQSSSNQGFYDSAASTLSHNHFANSPTSSSQGLLAQNDQSLMNPNCLNNDPYALLGGFTSSSSSNVVVNDFGDADIGILQGLMNSQAPTTDHQSPSGGLFDLVSGTTFSMGGWDWDRSTINGRGGRNGAPLDTEMKFSHPNYPFGKP